MEGVSTVMPLAVKAANAIVMRSKSSPDDPSEARAEAVEAGAEREAETARRQVRERVGRLRGEAQRKEAGARVAAADSGLELSGTPLLSLEAIEHADDERENRLWGDAAVRARGILDSGAAQANSIRLSGQSRRAVIPGGGGFSSLLAQGGRALGF